MDEGPIKGGGRAWPFFNPSRVKRANGGGSKILMLPGEVRGIQLDLMLVGWRHGPARKFSCLRKPVIRTC